MLPSAFRPERRGARTDAAPSGGRDREVTPDGFRAGGGPAANRRTHAAPGRENQGMERSHLSPSNAVTPARSEDFQVPPTSGDEGGRSVLIVDDEPDVGQLVADVLNEEGWDATTVCSTQEALQLLRSHSYRLVIADLLMPDGGGRRIMEEISTLQRAVPVLIISGTIGLGKDSICEMGAVHCLAKPFTINQIIEAAAEAAGLQG